SVLPVQPTPVDHAFGETPAARGAAAHELGDVRSARRQRLRRYGLAIGSAVATTHRDEKDEIPAKVRKAFKQIMDNVGAKPHAYHSHTVDVPTQRSAPKTTTKALTAAFASGLPGRVYVALSVQPTAVHDRTRTSVRPLVVVIARESEEGLIFLTLYSRRHS